MWEKMTMDTNFTNYTKNAFKFNRLKFTMQTVKILEETIQENLHDPGFGDIFIYNSKSQSMQEKKLITWILIKLKNVYFVHVHQQQ